MIAVTCTRVMTGLAGPLEGRGEGRSDVCDGREESGCCHREGHNESRDGGGGVEGAGGGR